MAEEDGDASSCSSASPVPLHLRGKVTHFLPNLHADPAKFHAHIAALSGVGWSNKQIVIQNNVQLVCGGGAIGSTSGWDKVTQSLLTLKEQYPERVHLLISASDAFWIRVAHTLSESIELSVPQRMEKLKEFIASSPTWGWKNGIEGLRTTLAREGGKLASMISDQVLLDGLYTMWKQDDLHNICMRYFKNGKLAVFAEDTLFLPQAFGEDMQQLMASRLGDGGESLQDFVNSLNSIVDSQVQALAKGSKSDAMLDSLSSFYADTAKRETWRVDEVQAMPSEIVSALDSRGCHCVVFGGDCLWGESSLGEIGLTNDMATSDSKLSGLPFVRDQEGFRLVWAGGGGGICSVFEKGQLHVNGWLHDTRKVEYSLLAPKERGLLGGSSDYDYFIGHCLRDGRLVSARFSPSPVRVQPTSLKADDEESPMVVNQGGHVSCSVGMGGSNSIATDSGGGGGGGGGGGDHPQSTLGDVAKGALEDESEGTKGGPSSGGTSHSGVGVSGKRRTAAGGSMKRVQYVLTNLETREETVVNREELSSEKSKWMGQYPSSIIQPPTPPDFAENMSVRDVYDMIGRCRKAMGQSGHDPSLYKRNWEVIEGEDENSYDFTVLQFNTLAEGLSAPPPDIKKPPLPFDQTSSYGGFSKIPNPDVILDFDLRKWRLVEATASVAPDFIALQEVDHFHDFFSPVLAVLGWSGHFCPKRKSPCSQFGYYSDGVAVLWKTVNYKCTWHRKGQLDAGGAYVIVLLFGVTSKKDVMVATCHLKAKEIGENEDRRVKQMSEILDIIASYKPLCKTGQCILMGDFNAVSVPTKEASKKGEEGGESYSPRLVRYISESKMPKFESAFPLGDDAVMNSWFSTWKVRGKEETKRMIDYIFATDGLKVVSRLKPPTPEVMADYGLPAYGWPSDHLSYVARFRWAVVEDQGNLQGSMRHVLPDGYSHDDDEGGEKRVGMKGKEEADAVYKRQREEEGEEKKV